MTSTCTPGVYESVRPALYCPSVIVGMPTCLDSLKVSVTAGLITCVAAALVLSGFFKIREALPVVLADDSSDVAF